jgi:GNAT superfamily N-acetyltransferase
MPQLRVRKFEPADLPAAATLLAARHHVDRTRLPMLSSHLEQPASCEPYLARLANSPHAEGLVAISDGQVVGFLFGERMLLAPGHFASQFTPPHSISIPLQGHAVATGQDQTAVYRALYAELAAAWVAAGFFIHVAHIVPGDFETQEAWLALGFGRTVTAGVRPTSPVAVTRQAAIEVHQVGPEDIDVILGLAAELNAHHALSPIFWPILHATDDAAHAFNLSALTEGSNPYFVAYEAGKPLGMQAFLRPGFTPLTVAHDSDVYLYEGIVSQDSRSGGVGTALLAHSMDWARGKGYSTCTLHWASANPSGAPFWQGHGFVPVEHTMSRHVDERVAWARH